MQKYYLDKALNTAHEMIHAYYVERKIDGVFKYLSTENFSFIGFNDVNVFDSLETFREYAKVSLKYTLCYEIVGETYSVCSESQDSCQILAKINFLDTRTYKFLALNFFFYFILQDNQIMCPHYHVSQPYNVTKTVFSRSDYGMHINQSVMFYPTTRRIKIAGKIIDLTPIENEIFMVLADKLNEPIKREEIYEKILLNSELEVLSSVLAMHISNIRRKLRESDESIKIIYVKGEGYCLKA